MSAATTISNAFGESANLYTVVLSLPTSGPSVPHSQIRRAYYKRALAYHPDKQNPAKQSPQQIEDAKSKFHAVSVAYSILSNEASRAEYDETGELYDDHDDADESDKSGTDQWSEYFRGIFGSVTVSDIDEFEAKYKCSEEEEGDVLRYYGQFEGDLNKMLECVMLSREEDKARWVEDYIRPAIRKKSVEDYSENVDRTLVGRGGGDAVEEEEEEGGYSEEEMSEDEGVDDDDDDETESEVSSEEEEEKKKASSPPSAKKKKKERGKAKAATTTTTAAKNGRGKVPPKKKGGGSSKSSAKKKRSSGGAPDADLIAAIRGNAVARTGLGRTGFGSMIAGLEERYGGGGSSNGDGKKKRKKKKGTKKSSGAEMMPEEDDIDDDEFERIRASLGKR